MSFFKNGGVVTAVDNGYFYSGSEAFPVSTPMRSALYVGDSITAFSEVVASAITITNLGDGTANVNRNAHSMSVGNPVRTAAAPDPAVNVLNATVIRIVDANNFVISLDGPVHDVTGAAPVVAHPLRGSTRGWVSWLEAAMGRLLEKTWCAIPGARMSDITDVLPKIAQGHEDIAFVCMGMNDIYSANLSLAQCQAAFESMMPHVLVRSGRVVILSVPPRNSADPAWTAAKQIIHTGFNKYLYGRCVDEGWLFVDTWRSAQDNLTYVNSGAANPDPNAAMSFDNTHPSMRGAAAIGNAAFNVMSKWLGIDEWKGSHPEDINADIGNLLPLSDFSTDAAGVATGWARSDVTAAMNAVFTMEARTVAVDGDSCGRNQVMTINYGAAAGTASCRFRMNNIQASVVAGRSYQMLVPFRVTGAVGLVGLELAMFGTVGTAFWLTFAQNQDSNADPISGAFEGVLVTPVSECPVGVTDLDVWVRPYINATQVADVVIRVWQPQLYDVAQ